VFVTVIFADLQFAMAISSPDIFKIKGIKETFRKNNIINLIGAKLKHSRRLKFFLIGLSLSLTMLCHGNVLAIEIK